MTIYDAAMVVLVVGGMVWGAWRGMTWQVASIASLVLGYSVAHPLSGQLASHFPGDPIVARALAMLTVYVAVSGGVFLAAWIIRATLRKMKFEAYDRHLGMLLGGLEGVLLGIVVTIFVVSLAPSSRGPIFMSPSGRVVCQVLNTVGPVLPSEIRADLAPFWNSPPAVANEGPAPAAASPAPLPNPAETSPLSRLVEEGETRVGQAIAETVKKDFQEPGGRNAGAVERR